MTDANKMEMSKSRSSNIIHKTTRIIHSSTSYSLPTSAVGAICHFVYVSIALLCNREINYGPVSEHKAPPTDTLSRESNISSHSIHQGYTFTYILMKQKFNDLSEVLLILISLISLCIQNFELLLYKAETTHNFFPSF
jgi:hypothetical protein